MSGAAANDGPRRRVMFVTTGLATGGAEAMLFNLLSSLDQRRWQTDVISLGGRGAFADRIEGLGVEVTALELNTVGGLISGPFRLRQRVRAFRPFLIQGWMYHGNLAALLGGVLAEAYVPVLWNIRQSLHSLRREKLLTALVIRLGAKLSRRPQKIIYNSATSADQHQALGYKPSRRVLIPNGFDIARFRPVAGAREALRKYLDVPRDTPVIGHFARYHPMKDHTVFLRAAVDVLASRSEAIFLLAGTGVNQSNPTLHRVMRNLGISHRVRCLGEVSDPAPIMAGLDVLVLSSAWGEGFPNVLGEAMACGVPCVATDVGAAREVIGDTGRIVPPGDPGAIGSAILTILAMAPGAKVQLGAAARQRIASHFSLSTVTSSYESLYSDVLASSGWHPNDPNAQEPISRGRTSSRGR